MKVPFTKNELLSYLKKTRKRLRMSVDFDYGFYGKTVGCGMIIDYDDKDKEE